jgi:hypothetical protein
LFVWPHQADEHCSRAPPAIAIGALLNLMRQDSDVRMCVLIRHLRCIEPSGPLPGQAASLAMQVSDWLPSGLLAWGMGRHLLLASISIAACGARFRVVVIGLDDAGGPLGKEQGMVSACK